MGTIGIISLAVSLVLFGALAVYDYAFSRRKAKWEIYALEREARFYEVAAEELEAMRHE